MRVLNSSLTDMILRLYTKACFCLTCAVLEVGISFLCKVPNCGLQDCPLLLMTLPLASVRHPLFYASFVSEYSRLVYAYHIVYPTVNSLNQMIPWMALNLAMK